MITIFQELLQSLTLTEALFGDLEKDCVIGLEAKGAIDALFTCLCCLNTSVRHLSARVIAALASRQVC
jgi:hypothetical protein